MERPVSELFEKHFKLEGRLQGRVVPGDNPVTIDAVAANPDAIGYVSSGEAEREASAGAAIRIVSVGGVMPTERNVITGNYPLTRPLSLITRDSPPGRRRTSSTTASPRRWWTSSRSSTSSRMKISGAPPARRTATERIFSALNRYSLKSLLVGSVGLVVLFCLAGRRLRAREPGDRLPHGGQPDHRGQRDLGPLSQEHRRDDRRPAPREGLPAELPGIRLRGVAVEIHHAAARRRRRDQGEPGADSPCSPAIARRADRTREIEGALDRYRQGVEAWPTSSGSAATTTPASMGRWRPRCGS